MNNDQQPPDPPPAAASSLPLAIRLAWVAFPEGDWTDMGDHRAFNLRSGSRFHFFSVESLNDLHRAERRVCEAGHEWELAEYLGMVLIERRGVQSSGCQAFAQADERAEALRRLLDANPALEEALRSTPAPAETSPG